MADRGGNPALNAAQGGQLPNSVFALDDSPIAGSYGDSGGAFSSVLDGLTAINLASEDLSDSAAAPDMLLASPLPLPQQQAAEPAAVDSRTATACAGGIASGDGVSDAPGSSTSVDVPSCTPTPVPPRPPPPSAPIAPSTSTLTPPACPDGAIIKVWVRDAEATERSRIGVSLGSHTNYLLHTESRLRLGDLSEATGADGSSSISSGSSGMHTYETRRRFAEFEQLHRLLRHQFRGYFLPPLPGKALLQLSGDSGFMQVRKVDLQAYLRTLAAHPVLQRSEEVGLFLGVPSELAQCSRWTQLLQRAVPGDALLGLLRHVDATHALQSGADATTPAGGGGGGGLGMMLRMKLLNAVGTHRPRVRLSPEEAQLRQIKALLRELCQHLSGIVSSVRELMSNEEASADSVGELGRGLSHLARFDESCSEREGRYTPAGCAAAQRASDLQTVAYALLREHSLERQFVMRGSAALVTLHDHLVLLPEAVAALEEREAVLDTVAALQEELGEKRAAAERATAGERRAAGSNAAADALQARLAAAQEQYALLLERNNAEVVRLQLVRTADLRTALRAYAAVKLARAQASAALWHGLVTSMDDQQVDRQEAGG